jgi:hypothetical protein
MPHGEFRVPLDAVVRPECRADEADAVDDDEGVFQEMHIREPGSRGATVLESFLDGAAVELVVSGDIDAGHGVADVLGQPMDAVGGRPAKVAGDHTDVGIRNGKRLPQVGYFEMEVREHPDLHA